MDDTSGLTMEELKQRIDHLEAVSKESEGDPDLTAQVWDELKHLREVYDRMIMDSQGRGVQMMSDIMDKSPETRENYVAGVPVPSTERPAGEGRNLPASAVTPTVGMGLPPNISLTVNITKEEGHMERSLDTRAAELEKSDCGDVRIPLNMQADLIKARKKRQEKESSVDGIDQDKIRAAKKKEKEGEDEDEGKETEDQYGSAPVREGTPSGGEKFRYPKAEPKAPAMSKPTPQSYAFKSLAESFYRIETQTLQKSLMAFKGAKRSILAICGAWGHEHIAKKDVAFDTIAKSMRSTIEKAAGASIVAGLPAKCGHSKASAHAHIVGLNAEIQALQEKISGCSEPDQQVKYDKQLRQLMEHLSVAIMASEGLGVNTQDLIPGNTRKVDTQPGTEVKVDKSQKSHDLAKSGRHFTGKVGSLKYALSVWGGETSIDKSQAKKIAKAIAGDEKEEVQKSLVVGADKKKGAVKLIISSEK
jgi:hypothetical protein